VLRQCLNGNNGFVWIKKRSEDIKTYLMFERSKIIDNLMKFQWRKIFAFIKSLFITIFRNSCLRIFAYFSFDWNSFVNTGRNDIPFLPFRYYFRTLSFLFLLLLSKYKIYTEQRNKYVREERKKERVS